MQQTTNNDRMHKIYLGLACAALPVWILNALFGDWAANLVLLGFLVVLFFVCRAALRSTNERLKVFVGGALLGQGLIPLLVFLLVLERLFTALFGEHLAFLRLGEIITTPGSEVFLQIEERFGLDAVTYTTWYTMVRALIMRTVNCLVHGTLTLLIYQLVKRLQAKQVFNKVSRKL